MDVWKEKGTVPAGCKWEDHTQFCLLHASFPFAGACELDNTVKSHLKMLVLCLHYIFFLVNGIFRLKKKKCKIIKLILS